MQIANIQAQPRMPGNRNANQRLRKSGYVPAVIYGHGETPETVALSRHDLDLALGALQHVVQFEVAGKPVQYLIKDVQYDHLQKHPVHVDLMRVNMDEIVHVKVPIELKGTPKGLGAGGVLVHVITDLDIECRLADIPEAIRVNVSHMELGHGLHVRELELPQGVKAKHGPDEIIAIVRTQKGPEEVVAAAPVEGELAEPEVIGRVAKEKPAEAEE